MAVITRSGRGGDVNTSKQKEITYRKTVVPKAKAPFPRPPPPYPQRLEKQKNEKHFKKFIDMMKSLSVNVPLVEALEQILGYVKFMKDLVTKKIYMDCETIKMTHQVSAIVHSMAPKLEDPGAFTIPCTTGSANFAKELCDLGASINLMPYSVFKTLGIGQPRVTSMRLQMEDRTMKRPLGIIDDVLVQVDKFILPADFVILECKVDYEVPIILGRPFLVTGKAVVDVEAGELTFRVGDKKVVFHVCKSMKQLNSTEIILEDDAKPFVEHQRRLNEAMQEVAKKEVIKRLYAGVVYPIWDSSWSSSVQCVPKKGGMTVVTNACLDRLAGRAFYYFLDGYSGYNQILIAPEDQEKTTFMCPYGTFAFSRMQFGLSNAPATFQRCMMAIFTDMVEVFLEVCMEDFFVVGDLFDECLKNLDKVSARCEDTKLVLN
ncbi:uncharacterized protein [Nicotiana sylvestris]|uniref:uncharacterized protein n=1 Tax=Nicotiana sylvestris TaxID=4096 RepID=UPI00388CE2A5